MAEGRHIERALGACAEQGVPEITVPWPEIRDRALAGQDRSSQGRRFVPRTRVGWALAAVLVMLFSMGAYGASGVLTKMLQDEAPGGDVMDLGQKLDLVQTANGVRVTLEWAYADQSSVVIGYTIDDLKEDRRAFGYPTRLEPSFDREVVLTEESGVRLRNDDGVTWSGADEDAPVVAVFEPSGGMEADERERFRAEIPVGARVMAPTETTGLEASGPPDEDLPYQTKVGEPFVFDFEIPVRPVPTIRVGQSVEAGGVTLTLDRVINSPARPQAVFCFEPPDDEHNWFVYDFVGASASAGNADNCRSYLLRSGLEGRSSVTVTRIEGTPRPGTFRDDEEFNQQVRTIRGPWTFEFEVPRN